MRRIDKMTKEQIAEFYEKALEDCNVCPMKGECEKSAGKFCNELAHEYMFAEIPIKSRWQLCKTDEDFEALWDAFGNDERFIHSSSALYAYLTEKVEVSE